MVHFRKLAVGPSNANTIAGSFIPTIRKPSPKHFNPSTSIHDIDIVDHFKHGLPNYYTYFFVFSLKSQHSKHKHTIESGEHASVD